jgi:hypothetical protein
MIKLSWKYRIAFALFTALFYSFLLWLVDYFIEKDLYSTKSLIFQGILFGVVFGIGFPYINKKLASKFSRNVGTNIKPTLKPEEIVEVQGPANLFRGIEGVSGKIFLTNKRLIFKPHSITIQKSQTDIPYAQIESLTKRKTAILIDNGIRVITKKGKKFDFVVNERDLIIEKIEEKLI